MKTDRSTGKWWLAALLIPFLSFGIGVVCGLSSRGSENDWLGGHIILPIAASILVGCIISVIATGVSFVRGERLSYLSLLVSIPAVIVLGYGGVSYVKFHRAAKVQEAAQKQYWEAELETQKLRRQCMEELRKNPEVITDDGFWKSHDRMDKAYQYGLLDLLYEPDFHVTKEIKTYVMSKMPSYSAGLFSKNRLSREELDEIIATKAAPDYLKAWAESDRKLQATSSREESNKTSTVSEQSGK
jgi:hypothetical protein